MWDDVICDSVCSESTGRYGEICERWLLQFHVRTFKECHMCYVVMRVIVQKFRSMISKLLCVCVKSCAK